MRVSMSAMGSVIMSAPPPSPRRLRQARHLAGMDHLAQADAAEPEAPVHRARAAAPAATGVRANLELRLALLLLHECLLRHLYLLSRGYWSRLNGKPSARR